MSLTRRLFLNRIGATTAAAAAVTLPPAACTVIPDDAQLVALGKKMERAEASFVEADDAYRSALARAQQMAPEVPKGLIVDSRYQYQGHTERERGIDHEVMQDCRWLLTERHLMDEAEIYAGLVGKVARRNEEATRKLLADRAAYVAGMDAARQASGYTDACTVRHWIMREVEDAAKAIFAIEASSPAGLLIQARAFTTAATMENGRNWVPHVFGPKLAASAERVLGATS
ncbi:hypothetical protein [Bosea sp. PAMC 26642]|uniref:hypothetical protein n=1 Tax=Bosea sp. (strain PAMC 26642) TaxID=1792307 RepID=UPI0007704320|nr:hypothetical protein [Bosea sp. PAMC 26642]AMJ61993.1 hypothetical protein AXW83_18305 [Bosea sp. PAMC 26642]